MNTKVTNLFIVDHNPVKAGGLKIYLEERFGIAILVSIFSDGRSCLKKVGAETHFVILEDHAGDAESLEILQSIKTINPQTQVILLAEHADIGTAIESFRMGAKEYLVKGPGLLKKIGKSVSYIVTAPIHILVREFGVSKFVATFLLTFVTMGVVVFFVVRSMN